jgi:hypothetical protein
VDPRWHASPTRPIRLSDTAALPARPDAASEAWGHRVAGCRHRAAPRRSVRRDVLDALAWWAIWLACCAGALVATVAAVRHWSTW